MKISVFNPNLVGGVILPCWFSFNNLETVKAVILTFCFIQQLFIKDVCAKFGIPNSPQAPGIERNSDRGIYDFRISGQSLINDNCHNSRTSVDIDMKLELVTKFDKRNTATSKKFDDDVTSTTSDALRIFPIYGQFGAIRKPDSVRMVRKTFALALTFYRPKTEIGSGKSLTQLSYYCFE